MAKASDKKSSQTKEIPLKSIANLFPLVGLVKFFGNLREALKVLKIHGEHIQVTLPVTAE